MPSISKKQQKLFAIVHGYQTGKIPSDKVSAKIKKIAKSISAADAKKFASTRTADIKELAEVFNLPIYLQEILEEIVHTNVANYIKGQLVDVFTARMLLTVMNKLNESNKQILVNRPLNEMVAISYKVLTY